MPLRACTCFESRMYVQVLENEQVHVLENEQVYVRMANLERSIRWSSDGPYLAGSSSRCNLSELGEADEVCCAYVAYDRMETQAIKAIESLFCTSKTVSKTDHHVPGPHRGSRPHSAPSFLPERWARFAGAPSAIANEVDAPGFDGMPTPGLPAPTAYLEVNIKRTTSDGSAC